MIAKVLTMDESEELVVCTCGTEMRPFQTTYGYRATCTSCRSRWTQITGEAPYWFDEGKAQQWGTFH